MPWLKKVANPEGSIPQHDCELPNRLAGWSRRIDMLPDTPGLGSLWICPDCLRVWKVSWSNDSLNYYWQQKVWAVEGIRRDYLASRTGSGDDRT